MSSNFISTLLISTLLIFALILNTADALLKCWRCSTDVSNGEFCNDPFDPAYISDQQRYWSYVNCTYSTTVRQNNIRPVCKKLIQEVYGKRVVSRSCFYEDMDDNSDKCAQDTTSSYIKTIYCHTCNTDGCNGAIGMQAYKGTMLILPLLGLLLINFFK